jgi:PEGA domain-containing protein
MKKGLLVLAVALMTLAPISASAAIFYRPYYGAYWGPGYYGGYYPYAGQIKLDTKVKTAEVFIDGAFAGNTHDARTMHLRPGSYNVEIRELGVTKFVQQVYVVPGKTLHLHPVL